MSRTAKIVSMEPPDPISDPRVEEILMEMNVEVVSANNKAKSYNVGENFNYFRDEVNVDVTGDDDNDLVDDNDTDDVVDETINVKKKTKMTKRIVQEENRNEKETKKIMYQIAVESWKNGEFPSVRACASYYNLDHSTLWRKIKTGEEYIGKGRKSQVRNCSNWHILLHWESLHSSMTPQQSGTCTFCLLFILFSSWTILLVILTEFVLFLLILYLVTIMVNKLACFQVKLLTIIGFFLEVYPHLILTQRS